MQSRTNATTWGFLPRQHICWSAFKWKSTFEAGRREYSLFHREARSDLEAQWDPEKEGEREREREWVLHTTCKKKKKEHLSSLFPVLICWFLPLHCFHIGSTLAVFIQTRSVAHANGLLLLFPQVAWFHSRGFYPWKESAFRNIFDILFSLHRKKKEASSLVQKPLWHSFCSWMNRNGKKKKNGVKISMSLYFRCVSFWRKVNLFVWMCSFHEKLLNDLTHAWCVRSIWLWVPLIIHRIFHLNSTSEMMHSKVAFLFSQED